MSGTYREFVDSREGFDDNEDWAEFEAWLDGRLDAFEQEKANSELTAAGVVSNVVSGWIDAALQVGDVPTIPASLESVLGIV